MTKEFITLKTKPWLEKAYHFQVIFNMERGAGKYWAEEEFSFAKCPGRKKIYKNNLMESLLRNVAKRLEALEVHRDWQQCRAKHRNLKINTEQLNLLTTLNTVLKL